MNIFDNYTKDVVIALNEANVKYMVVGGYAVNFHGYHRGTGDIDLWIEPTNENKDKITNALKILNIDDEVINLIKTFDFTKPIVFSDGEVPFKIDFMTYVSHVNFEEAWLQKIDTEIDTISISFINLNHLVISKFNTGRLKDKADRRITKNPKAQKIILTSASFLS